MLYSIGKDSAVMLHLARKAFFSRQAAVPVLHVDTGWKFQAMYEFRDLHGRRHGPRSAGAQESGRVRPGHQPLHPWQCQAHRHHEDPGPQAGADKYGFDAAFGGAPPRRGEVPRQGARLLLPGQQAPLGSQEPASPSCGTSTTARPTRASRSASSRCRTGPSWTSGSTSTSKASDRAAVLRRRARGDREETAPCS